MVLRDLLVILVSRDSQDFREVLVLEKRELRDLLVTRDSKDSQDFREV